MIAPSRQCRRDRGRPGRPLHPCQWRKWRVENFSAAPHAPVTPAAGAPQLRVQPMGRCDLGDSRQATLESASSKHLPTRKRKKKCPLHLASRTTSIGKLPPRVESAPPLLPSSLTRHTHSTCSPPSESPRAGSHPHSVSPPCAPPPPGPTSPRALLYVLRPQNTLSGPN